MWAGECVQRIVELFALNAPACQTKALGPDELDRLCTYELDCDCQLLQLHYMDISTNRLSGTLPSFPDGLAQASHVA